MFAACACGQKTLPGCVGLFVEALGRVAVEDRAAERDVIGAVAVAANRHVPAGHHELELVAARRAENGDAVVRAVAARVVAQLLVDPLVPLGADDALENAADDRPLIVGVEIALDHLLGDFPVVRDPRPQQAARRVLVVPRKANCLALLRRKRIVQHLHQRLGRLRPDCTGCDRSGRFGLRPNAARRQHTADRTRCQHRAAGCRQKIASRQAAILVRLLAAITRRLR